MIVLLLIACHADKTVVLDDDTGTGIIWDTGIVHDSSTGDDSGDSSDTADTADTAEDVVWTGLVVSPDNLVVQPGARWRLRGVGTTDDGVRHELTGPWTSSDEAVVTVDSNGLASAIAEGEASFTLTLDPETYASLHVTVQDDGQIRVTAYDAETGAAIAGVSVVIDNGSRTNDDDDDGVVTATVDTGAGVAVTAYARGYVPATAWSTVSRDVVLPLRPLDAAETSATVSGDIDLSGTSEAGFGEIVVGLAAPAIQGPPLLVQPEDLLAGTRTVSVYGVDAELPENLYIDGVVEDYLAPVEAGPAAVWTLAGPLPIADVTAGLDGAGDALSLLSAHVDDLRWTWGNAGTVAAGENADLDLAPDQALSAHLSVNVGSLPLGFEGTEDVLVLVGPTLAGGLVITGFGLGQDDVDVAAVPVDGDDSVRAIAVAQVDGLGSGGALCASSAEISAGATSLPILPDVAVISDFDGSTRDFSISTDTRLRYVAVTVTGGDGGQRDIYFDGGAVSGSLPSAGIPFSYGHTVWTLLGLDTEHGAFEEFISTGRLKAQDVGDGATVAVRASQEF